MSAPKMRHRRPEAVLNRSQLGELMDRIRREGFTIIGPTVRSSVIDIGPLSSIDELPFGWAARQGPGSYRLIRSDSPLAFHHTVGPTPWKRFLIPDDLVYWRARRTMDGFAITPSTPKAPRLAFWGIRPCDLHAIEVLDRVFLGGTCRQDPESSLSDAARPTEPTYRRPREDLLLIAFHCAFPAEVCFCTSMGTGPRAVGGFDLAFVELLVGGEVLYLGETGSARGERLLSGVPSRPATSGVMEAAERQHRRAVESICKEIPREEVKELLYRCLDHPRWLQTAQRCFTCGNCTLVCPTCFCSTILDSTDLAGMEAERRRRWDSCFSLEFSYLHGGGSVRTSPAARFRNWVVHKLATWQDQFETSGCVGCGRCITWCPAGIDLCEEIHAIRESDRHPKPTPEEVCHEPL